MKFSLAAIVALATTVSAFPASQGSNAIKQRASSASVTDVCDIGYCTQNGGTTGGSSGSQTTVTTLDDLKTAAEADGAAIIIIDGRKYLEVTQRPLPLRSEPEPSLLTNPSFL